MLDGQLHLMAKNGFYLAAFDAEIMSLPEEV